MKKSGQKRPDKSPSRMGQRERTQKNKLNAIRRIARRKLEMPQSKPAQTLGELSPEDRAKLEKE